MHTTMHSPKMTRSLQQISDKFGGSLGSLPALPAVNKIPNKLQLGDKLHTVQVKVGVTGEGRERSRDRTYITNICNAFIPLLYSDGKNRMLSDDHSDHGHYWRMHFTLYFHTTS